MWSVKKLRGRKLAKNARYAENRGRPHRCSSLKTRIKTCRCSPPKKYRQKGATARSDYAFPECWMYPIRFRAGRKVRVRLTKKHIRVAAGRFGKHSRRYPIAVRRRIAKNIQKAKARYGIGAARVR
jgi:hypothetical protein